MRISRQGFLILNYVPIASIASAIITPALPQIKDCYHVSFGKLEWVVSIYLIGYMLGQLIYGPWSNRVGRVFVLRVGLCLALFGIALSYLAYIFPMYWLLLLGRFLSAIGGASGLVCAFTLINDNFEFEETKTLFAYAPISFSLGVASSIFLGGVITHLWGWEYTLIFLFAHNLVMLFLTPFIEEKFNREKFIQEMKEHAAIKVKSKNIIKLLAFSLIVGTTTCFTYCYTTAAPIISDLQFHYNPSQYGVWNLINFFGVLLATVTMTLGMQKLGGKKVVLISLVVLIGVLTSYLMVMWAGYISPLWFFMTSCIMYFATSWGFAAACYFGTRSIANKALASSILGFINILCAVVGVIIMGYLNFDEIVDLAVVCSTFLGGSLMVYLWLSMSKSFENMAIE